MPILRLIQPESCLISRKSSDHLTTKNRLRSEIAIIRGSLKEVLTDNQARLQIAQTNVEQFETIKHLLLFRPVGSTTAPLKAAPIVDESERIEGVSDCQARSLQTSKQHLKQIGLALHNFHSAHRSFPPATIMGPDRKPWHSWRVFLLPYLGQKELYNRYKFDEPWNGPNNKMLIAEMPDVFHDPPSSLD